MRQTGEKQGWSRRGFLKGAGVAIGLPFFPSLFPSTAWADGVKPPVRLMFMCVPLGFVPNKSLLNVPIFEAIGSKGWFPEEDGPQYKMPDVHTGLEPYREHISFLKGLSNHCYRGDAHFGDDVFLTGANTFADPSKAFTNTVSCDQVAAGSEIMGGQDVRYRSLALGIRKEMGSRTGGLSWTDNGVPISPLYSPAQVFDQLFGKEDVPAEIRLQRLQQKKSALDVVLEQTRNLKGKLNATDRDKLDEVLTAVRGVETNIQREERWLNIEKPKVSFSRPEDEIATNSIHHAETMFDLAHAAFLTDSTRIISYEMPSYFTEVTHYFKHQLNHDCNREIALDSVKVDRAMSDRVASFIKRLCDSKDHDGQALIQSTLAAYGSGAWGASHSLRSLPCMLIGHGGGIKQGATRTYPESTPLANLWLTMLTAAGVPVPGNKFADSTGPLAELI